MPVNPSALRAPKNPLSPRRGGIVLAAALVACGVLAAAAPAVADSLETPSLNVVTTALHDHQVTIATTAAQNALEKAAAANADAEASGFTLTSPLVDTAELQAELLQTLLPVPVGTTQLDRLTVASNRASAGTVTLSAELAATRQRIADEQAAAAKAKAEADAAAAAAAAANTPDGAMATARSLALSNYGWGDDQFSCLESLWNKESGWNYQAENPSGAYGIPQSLPGDKMASVGSDWATNATTQITWGLQYINGSYGSPCAAWGHSQATDWY